MTWSNLLSGFIGAVVGGAFSIATAMITTRGERSRIRRDVSRGAANAIMRNIVTIGNAMSRIQSAMNPDSQPPDSDIEKLIAGSMEEVNTATQSILYEHKALISDPALRARIDSLVDMIEKWSEDAQVAPNDVISRGIDSIKSYMKGVTDSLDAHRGG